MAAFLGKFPYWPFGPKRRDYYWKIFWLEELRENRVIGDLSQRWL